MDRTAAVTVSVQLYRPFPTKQSDTFQGLSPKYLHPTFTTLATRKGIT
jgi:hypothetical protein